MNEPFTEINLGSTTICLILKYSF